MRLFTFIFLFSFSFGISVARAQESNPNAFQPDNSRYTYSTLPAAPEKLHKTRERKHRSGKALRRAKWRFEQRQKKGRTDYLEFQAGLTEAQLEYHRKKIDDIERRTKEIKKRNPGQSYHDELANKQREYQQRMIQNIKRNKKLKKKRRKYRYKNPNHCYCSD